VPDVPPVDVTGRPTALRKIDLDGFFHPRSVAVIGASDTPRRPNSAMFTKIRAWAEVAGATIHPVNPNREELGGLRCYRSVLDVPGELDLAVILVGQAVQAFEEVREKKARFAVIFAAGFAEAGAEGETAQAQLARLVHESDVHLLGPNTNLNAFETFREELPGPRIALITQSGHQGRPIFQAQELGIALSHWAPTGNEVDLELADFAAYFADQSEVGVIAAYVEGFKDGRTLQLAADHAARRGKPMVMVKVGRTAEGQSMARSHTGHLTGSDAVTSAVFRQYGVTRVDGLDELQDTAAMLARSKPPAGDGVCVYAISGGTGAHMADLAAAAGLRLPDLSPATQDALRSMIPDYLRVSNPVDSGGAPSADERGRKILDAIVADPRVDVVICPITGALPSSSLPLARDLVAVGETTDKPICVIWGSPIGNEEAYTDVLLRSTLPVFRTFGNCVQAVRAYFDYHAFASRYASPFDKPVLRRSRAAAAVDHLLTPTTTLAEHAAKEVLSAYGIATPRERLCTSAREAAAAAEELGYPVVLKASSPDLAHKSELGLVHLGVGSATAVRRAHAELLEQVDAAADDVVLDGVLVAEQVSGGVEAVVGVADDELFGPTVMFGLGGVMVELYGDVTFRVPPFDRREARRMIDEVRAAALLKGFRGRPRLDVNAVVDVLMKVQRLAVDHAGRLAELDINPLAVRTKGAVALDALLVTH
jgi:acyl-CoA synthetase (NDP forming)